MLDKSLASPRDQFFQSFRNLGDYARRPQGAAVIGSIALHGLAAATIPLWASFDNAPPESQERSVVRVVDLPRRCKIVSFDNSVLRFINFRGEPRF